MISAIFATVAAKLAGLGVAAKAGIGLGVATAAVATAGVTGMVPVPGVDSGTRPAVEVELPEVPTAEADGGLQTATDAVAGEAGEPETAGRPEVTGLDRAAETPAGDHLPSSVPPANTGAASTGLDRAAQTPAGDHLPSFVPGPPANVPVAGAPASAGTTGIGVANRTPAAGRPPR